MPLTTSAAELDKQISRRTLPAPYTIVHVGKPSANFAQVVLEMASEPRKSVDIQPDLISCSRCACPLTAQAFALRLRTVPRPWPSCRPRGALLLSLRWRCWVVKLPRGLTRQARMAVGTHCLATQLPQSDFLSISLVSFFLSHFLISAELDAASSTTAAPVVSQPAAAVTVREPRHACCTSLAP